MSVVTSKLFRSTACWAFALFLAGASLGFAQDQPAMQNQSQTEPGWHQFSGPPPAPPADSMSPNGASNPWQPNGPPSGDNAQAPAYPPTAADQSSQSGFGGSWSNAQEPIVPPWLTIKSGTYLTVRTNQILSSDHNQPGDQFTATLEQPVVVDGLVVAARGETVVGRVVEAKKAGRIKGVSHLEIRLSRLTLVDGQQARIQSQMISEAGPTSRGRDAAGIATTTGLGAAIGAAANGGIGAAVGAGAGAIVGTVGTLLTRGRPTIIYPESLLTFRIDAPLTISTASAPNAFHNVELDAYAPSSQPQNQPPGPPSICNGRGCAPPPPPYPYPYFGPPLYIGWGRFYGPWR